MRSSVDESGPKRVHSTPGGLKPTETVAKAELRPLERDTSRFLVDLSIALHRFSMYPAGHPSRGLVLETVGRRVDTLLEERTRIAIGVARDRLVIEGAVTDPGHALLRALADRLHRHHLSALSIHRGVAMRELSDLVTAIAQDPARGGVALGQRTAAGETLWPHVSLHPLTVGALEMVSPDGSEGTPAGRGAVLWVGLAQAALGHDLTDVEQPETTEPGAVAKAIDEHEQAEAYDQVIVGYMQQIAEEVRACGGPETVELRHRVSTLVSAMQPETLERLLKMGGDAQRRLTFARTAATALSGGAVLDLVGATARASEEAMSDGLVRLLGKLAQHAETGAPDVQPLADSALRLQVSRLVSNWELPDPNPSDYAGVLDRLAVAPTRTSAGGGNAAGVEEHLRVLQICLDLDAEGPLLWRAIDGVARDGGIADAVALLHPIAARGGVAARAWASLASPSTVQTLLAHTPPDFAGIDTLLPHVPGPALGPLFDLLLQSEDRHVRRAVFDRLGRTGSRGAGEAIARLGDDRWFILRNLLALLAEIDDVPPACDPRPWLVHADARVRREALRVALRFEQLREQAVLAGLDDTDERVVRVAVSAVSAHPSSRAVARLAELARHDLENDDLRAAILEAVVRARRTPGTRDLLLEVASDGWRLRRPPRGGHSQALISALRALATYWREDPLVAPLLEWASASPDPEIRLAAGARSR
jgi:hypothetical protein